MLQEIAFSKATPEQQPKLSTIGISLPNQREIRWVRDRNAFYEYAKAQHIDIEIYFSDDDKYLQAYQIKKLTNSGIGILIVSADNSEEIVDALEYAKIKGVFIMSYDTLIVDTYAVDFYVAFNPDKYEMEDSSQMLHIDELKKVLSGDIEFTWLFDSGILAKTSLILADEFIDNPPKVKDYAQIDNGSRTVLAFWVEPVRVTIENYIPLLVDEGIVKKADVEINIK